MPKVKKIKSPTKDYPSIIKVDLAKQDPIHLGPFLPFNSAGFQIPVICSNQVVKTSSTIVVSPPKK